MAFRRATTPLAVAALAVFLAGCAHSELPRGLTADELQVVIDRQNEQWWNQMFPDEPMPVVEPIEYLGPFSSGQEVNDCIMATPIDGVTASQGGLQLANLSSENNDLFNRVQFTCVLQYPYDRSDPESMGYFSTEQLAFLYDYFTTRLSPCMTILGYRVSDAPSREFFVKSDFMTWIPYYSMYPQPNSEEEWSRIDLRCPPPPFGSYYRPGDDGAL